MKQNFFTKMQQAVFLRYLQVVEAMFQLETIGNRAESVCGEKGTTQGRKGHSSPNRFSLRQRVVRGIFKISAAAAL